MDVVQVLKSAKKASKIMGRLSHEKRNQILESLAQALIDHTEEILEENALDVEKKSMDDPMRDRLFLNSSRVNDLAVGIRQLIALPHPDGAVVSTIIKENGLKINKILVPLGVVAAIYESRPNVTIDIAALGIKSGNVTVLRGGSDAQNTNLCLRKIIYKVLESYQLPTEIVTFYPIERDYILTLLRASNYVDMIIPRGSAALIQYVKENSLVPSIETGAGVCHTYVSKHADLDKAVDIVVNAKTTRPSVCNSLDTIIIDKAIVEPFISKVIKGLAEYNVEIYADAFAQPLLEKYAYPYINTASNETFATEFLSYKCNMKVVENIEEALDHIDKYSTKHSEAIVSENSEEINWFLSEVDAASVYANASTRFTDGFEFGLGAEIGISTQKLHARGPFALEKLVCEKWIGIGHGQIRN